MRVQVNDGTQVNHEGTVYPAGEVLELPDDQAGTLIAAGIVTETSGGRSTARRR